MARTQITVQELLAAGIDLSFDDAIAAGHKFTNGGNTALLVDNQDASDVDVTVQTAREVDGLAVPDRDKTVAAGDKAMIPLSNKSLYNRQGTGTDDGMVYIDYGGAATLSNVKVAVVKY